MYSLYVFQLEVNNSMEPKPEMGNIFIQRFGNATGPITLNGTDLAFNKTEHPNGVYALQVGDRKFDLNLTKPQGAYVLGLFNTVDRSE